MNTPSLPAAWLEHDLKMRPYIWRNRALSWTGSVIGLILVGFVIFAGWGRGLEERVVAKCGDGFVSWLAYFGILSLAWKIISLPLSYGHYLVERKQGLSRQSPLSWLADQGKGLVLGALLGAIALSLIYVSVLEFPKGWWLLCATLLILFSIILAQLTPILLIPLFFKMKPMEAGALKERLLALCERFGVEVKEVFHLGLGEKTEKGNAAFLGLGRTKRIVIGDTLYEKFPPEEVEAVFAHELGHQVHNDLWKGIGLSAVFLYFGFGVAAAILSGWILKGNPPDPASPYDILMFFFVLTVVQMPLGILQAMHSRAREWAADGFADIRIGQSKALAAALERLTYQNNGQFKPNRFLEFIGHSHPASWRRITALRK